MTRSTLAIDLVTQGHAWSRDHGWQDFVLPDNWALSWRRDIPADDYALLCPFHANGLKVPRDAAFLTFGEITIDLQEFDYVGQRSTFVLLKHTETKRYLQIAESNGKAIARHLVDGRLEPLSIADALAKARSR